jgi:hypothetical protein
LFCTIRGDHGKNVREIRVWTPTSSVLNAKELLAKKVLAALRHSCTKRHHPMPVWLNDNAQIVREVVARQESPSLHTPTTHSVVETNTFPETQETHPASISFHFF